MSFWKVDAHPHRGGCNSRFLHLVSSTHRKEKTHHARQAFASQLAVVRPLVHLDQDVPFLILKLNLLLRI